MRSFDKINSRFAALFRKRRFAILDGADERWGAELSPITFTAILLSLVALIFGILLLLVAYTPLLDIMPGYRTNAGRSREMLIRSIVRIDSLERKMNEMLTYNENRILVVGGKTPVTKMAQNDSLRRSKSGVLPSKEDSLLRQQIENDPRYRLNTASPNILAQSELNAISPIYGLISERFSAKGSLLGVKINGKPEAPVTAIADGVVISSYWSPEIGYCAVIQHKNNFVSVYRHLAEVLPRKGVRVRQGEAIGHPLAEKEGGELSTLEFELWRDGKAVNPELYIAF